MNILGQVLCDFFFLLYCVYCGDVLVLVVVFVCLSVCLSVCLDCNLSSWRINVYISNITICGRTVEEDYTIVLFHVWPAARFCELVQTNWVEGGVEKASWAARGRCDDASSGDEATTRDCRETVLRLERRQQGRLRADIHSTTDLRRHVRRFTAV